MLYDIDRYNKGIEYVLDVNDLRDINHCTILVTGCNGLIGSSIVDVLHYLNIKYKCDIQIIGTVRDKNKILDRFLNYQDLNVLEYDVNNRLDILDDVDYIIHAASNAHPAKFSLEPVETIVSSFVGTKNILDFALKKCCKRLVYISSGEIYGQGIDESVFFDEEYCGDIHSMNPRSCYPLGKLSSETLCASYTFQYHMDTVVARLCHTYGPTQTDTDSRVSALFIRNILNHEDIVMKSDGSQVRSYCYVLDSVVGILTILLRGKMGEAYNVANNNSILSIREMAEILANIGNQKVIFDYPSELEKNGYNPVTRSVLDGSKLEQLNWAPCYTFRDGIEETIKIMKKVKRY